MKNTINDSVIFVLIESINFITYTIFKNKIRNLSFYLNCNGCPTEQVVLVCAILLIQEN